MNAAELTVISIRLLADRNIDSRIKSLFETGRIFEYKNHFTKAMDIEGFMPEMSYEVTPCPPCWDMLAIHEFDDAIVGEDGEWQHAVSFLPIFLIDGGVLVITLDSSELAIGYFSESDWDNESEGFDRGVLSLWSSLEAFLNSLASTPGGSVEEENISTLHVGDEVWSEG
ncbi:MAG: hypothetical protein COA99_07040 [Moraxellaceae bacterium]|nr:MAG: hypothetical protein COA99_07040 [Moraxellaceae bacterium]